jgi:hypothetical protein
MVGRSSRFCCGQFSAGFVGLNGPIAHLLVGEDVSSELNLSKGALSELPSNLSSARKGKKVMLASVPTRGEIKRCALLAYNGGLVL